MITVEEFQKYRPLLFSIAYRMLGSASEAEDVVQDAYLRYSGAAAGEVRSMKSYLTTIVSRLCLDRLKSARVEREQYVGPWLPEPMLTDDTLATPLDTTEKLESISMAFLTMLERLSPQERAVLLLHDVFEYDYDEIAEILDKNAASCRQILHRAKERISESRPRFEPSRERHKQLMESFMAACQRGDLESLTSLLAQDAVALSDGGGKVRAALRPIIGRDNIVRFMLGLMGKAPLNMRFTWEEVNGQPSFLTWFGDRLMNIASCDIVGDKIQALRFVVNPDKLAYILNQLETRAEK
jgi:RNA polymerase sigma-70 factor, ECF subfamily